MSGTTSGPVLLLPFRAIGTLIPDCAVDEHHSDRMIITEHPVEQGASINDHAYKLPSELSLRFGWSNSSPASGGSESYVVDIYNQLLQMQADRQPFSITTGKRQYVNMLIASLEVTTDSGSEYMLMVQAMCKEVIIVETQGASLAPASSHLLPNKTAPRIDTGTQALQPVSQGQLPSVLP